MQVAQMLKGKERGVITNTADATIAETARTLERERIGAIIVTGSGGAVEGILSERDIVRGVSKHGAGCLDLRVGDLMTRSVFTCTPAHTVEDVMREMTSRRIRHIPVLEGETLAGMISIGDVVKTRLDEVEMESDMLRNYLAGR